MAHSLPHPRPDTCRDLAVLPVGYGGKATHSLPHLPRSAKRGRAGGPLATSDQALGQAATAFLARPSLARSTRHCYDQTLARLVHQLGGDRPLSQLSVEAITVAVTAA
jgi:hypothetical protein